MSNLNPESDYSNLSNSMDFVLWQFKKGLRTSLPANIVEYDAQTKRAVVRPSIKTLSTNGELMQKALIRDVPILQPSAGGFVLNFPINEGDPILLIISERGLTLFKKTFEESDPAPLVVMNPADAVGIVGFGSLEITPSTDKGVSLQKDDGSSYINIDNSGNVNVKCGTFTITADHYVVDAGRIDYL